MKNKKLVYVLLPATIAVWGIAFMRIYAYFHAGAAAELPVQMLPELNTEVYANDTFCLSGDYRDPFLGSVKPSGNDVPKAVKMLPPKAPQKPAPVKETAWPVIQYTGMIKNQKSNTQLAMIQVNGDSRIMKVGESNGNVKLNRIFRDSVEIVYEKQEKIIRK